jgi:transcriptional regulator with XRE-family HTH domain
MSIGIVRIKRNARYRRGPYNLIVLDWYLSDWMKSLKVSQAELGRLTDYPKAKVSDLVTGKQRYNRDIMNDIAHALNIKPHELLMHPSDAMAVRKMKRLAEQMVMPEHGGTTTDEVELPALSRKAS